MKKLKWLGIFMTVLMSFAVFAGACNKNNDTPPPSETEYTVTYYDGTETLKTEIVKEGNKATRWTPQKTDHTFDNWYKESACTTLFDFDAPITADTPVYAKFTKNPKQYTVTYYDGTDTLKTEKVTEGNKAAEWIPKKTGFVFDGWFKDEGCTQPFSFDDAINADTPVYAKFTSEAQAAQYPVVLAADGKSFTYGAKGSEQTVTIDAQNLFVDGSLSDEKVEGLENVFNTFNAAIEAAVDGTEETPMNIWVAPYVYWIHDPDSESTTNPFGITKSCKNLHITGLSDRAENVVIAANYGHDEGFAGGNWTMFSITGNGLTLKNITFGDYCNVDLVYPLNPELNRAKRTENVTQGQIGSYNGDKLYAENVRFISRLNMMPFISNARALYVNCHMESTDDSLNGSSKAVYLNCDFEFYSSKPWGGSSGVTLLDCDIKVTHINVGDSVQQYFAKGAGPFTVIDCRITDNYKIPFTLGWSDILSNTFKSYYSNITRNGTPIIPDNGGTAPETAVDLTGKDALKAFKLTTDKGETIYNVYNLLRGTDDWDPLNQKAAVTALGAQDLPISMSASTDKRSIETGSQNDTANLSFRVSGPQATDYSAKASVTWSIKDADKTRAVLTPSEDGKTCTLQGANNEEEAVTVIVTAKSADGLEAAVAVTVSPSILPAPTFTTTPQIKLNENGTADVEYVLDLGERADMSRIVWAVCDDAQGTNAKTVAIGRSATPLKSIPLNKGYVGKYLKVTVEPKHIRSGYGDAVTAYSSAAVTDTGIPEMTKYDVDLSTISLETQTDYMPGLWMSDTYQPLDTKSDTQLHNGQFKANWSATGQAGWNYGTGAKNGYLNYTGIYNNVRGARLRYAPVGDTFGDMDVTLKIAPGKTAAQGFGSANQYLDVMIKYDVQNLTGYGLRIFRSSGDSCKFALMSYTQDQSAILTEVPVESSAFLTECTVHVWTQDGKLHAHVESTQAQPSTAADKGYAAEVDLTADITANTYGGFCIVHTGTTGDNSIYIGAISLEWK